LVGGLLSIRHVEQYENKRDETENDPDEQAFGLGVLAEQQAAGQQNEEEKKSESEYERKRHAYQLS
jgi:hypothetical protein